MKTQTAVPSGPPVPMPDSGTRFRALLLHSAQADARTAAKLCRDFALDTSYEDTGPLLDISAYPTVRFSHTGEQATAGSLAAFKALAVNVSAGRAALYEAEKARGTPDAVILDKLFSYMDAQADEYLSKIGWSRPPAGTL